MMLDISGPHLAQHRTLLVSDTLGSDAESDLTPISPKSSDCYTYSRSGNGTGKAGSVKNGGKPMD